MSFLFLIGVRKSRILWDVNNFESHPGSVGLDLRVLGTEVLDSAKKTHRDLTPSVTTWLMIAWEATWKNLNEVRLTWRNTDCVKGKTIFNIKGNRYRLIAVVNYASQTIIVKMLITHAEYSIGGWNK
jgi:mRNA interferase HigB